MTEVENQSEGLSTIKQKSIPLIYHDLQDMGWTP